MRRAALGCVWLLLFTATASAQWLEASSDHFVIYSGQNEKAVREFAERLERFHAAMAYVYKKEPVKPSPSNRVTIFVVASDAEVRKVTGVNNQLVRGVYLPRAGSSIAVIPKLKGASKLELSGETVLYHEYAHHLMISGLATRAYPRWFVEGFAEYFAGVKFKDDGSIMLGTPPYFRAMEVAYGREVPIRRLLEFDGGITIENAGLDTFYAQSWALFHYLQMSPERAGQISAYGRQLAAGRSALKAAEAAFGNLDQLNKDLDNYMRRHRVNVLVLDRSKVASGPIALRKLRPGEGAMMPVIIESKVGVSPDEAKGLLPEARKIASSYPEDPVVLTALAEAEFDAGNDDEAIAAADRAIAIDPQQVNAHIQKGYALSRKVQSGALPEESWAAVRTQFAKANRIENDHPIPLMHFYLGYLAQNQKPSKNAIDGLEWALQLAPFDPALRWLVVQQMIADERFQEAANTLAPLAYSPHPGEHTDKARQLLKEIEARLESTAPVGKDE